MEAEELTKTLIEIIRTVSDTQSSQTRVIDKLSDGLLRTTHIISGMKNEIRFLEKRIETLEKEAKE